MTHSLSDDYCTRFNVSKPPLPYLIGQEYWIRSHIPPAPTEDSRALTAITRREREEVHPLKRCFLHPPLPGSIGNMIARLKLLREIRVGDGHNAQLFNAKVVQVKPECSSAPPSNITLVAKFYDPLYCDHRQDDGDPFLCTDKDYACEVEAYRVLESFQGTTVPKYYGSYTCELPTPDGSRRSVRLILMEHISGSSLQQLKPTSFSRVERQTILKQIIDADSAFYSRDVTHGDLYPRNVLVSGSALNPSRFRVVLIDFGKSRFTRYHPSATLEERQKVFSLIPISPLLRWNKAWWGYRQICFAEWIDWDWQPWLEHHWSGGAVITPGMEEIWLPYDLINPPRFEDF